MYFLSSWDAYTGSVHAWLTGLLEAGKVELDSIVSRAADGGYAVGDDYPDAEEENQYVEWTDDGTVQEWLDVIESLYG